MQLRKLQSCPVANQKEAGSAHGAGIPTA